MKTLDYSVPLNGSVAEEHSTGIYKKSQTVVDKIINLRGGFAIVALTVVKADRCDVGIIGFCPVKASHGI